MLGWVDFGEFPGEVAIVVAAGGVDGGTVCDVVVAVVSARLWLLRGNRCRGKIGRCGSSGRLRAVGVLTVVVWLLVLVVRKYHLKLKFLLIDPESRLWLYLVQSPPLRSRTRILLTHADSRG